MVGLMKTPWLFVFIAFLALSPSFLQAQTAPTFTSTPELSGTYNTVYHYPVKTSDDDASPREIILSSGILPNGVTLTDNGDGTAELQGTPLEIGSFPVELKVRETGSPFLEEAQAFTITVKAILTVTADDQTRVYGQSNPAFTVSITGFLNGDDETELDAMPAASSLADQNSNVGSYTITAAGGSDDLYDFNYQAGTLSISKASISVVADAQSMVYGDAIPTLTAQYSGFVNGDDETDIDTKPSINTTAMATTGAGTYSITPSAGSDNNYVFTYTASSLTIGKATLQVIADAQSKVYGTINPALTYQYTGFVHGDDATVLNTQPGISTTALTTSPVGSYLITPTGGTDNDYTYSYATAQLTVTQATLSIIATNKSITYGQAIPTLTYTYSGFVGGDNAADIDVLPSISTTAISTSGAGVYPITPSGGSDNNYAFSYTSANLTIGKASIQIATDAKSMTYGQALPTLTAAYSGFVFSDGVAEIDLLPSISTAATSASNVGTYPITANGASDNNYNFTYTSANLTITKATLQVTADAKTKVYGTTNPTLTYQYAGFLNGDDATVLNTQPNITTSANATSHVGTYAINVSGGSDNNYNYSYTGALLTVTPATLDVTADNKTRVYGAANPTFTKVYSGFVNGDSQADLTTIPALSTSATATSNVGVYSIDVSGGVDDDYSLQYHAGQLTVTKATVNVTVSNATKIYGQPNPTFPLIFSGFANGETESVIDDLPVASTTAGLNSNVGTYPITVSGGLDNNYGFTYGSATLTITKATATVQITSLLQNVDGSPKPVTVTTTPVGLTTTITYNGSATVPTAKGTYTVIATIQDTNYQGTSTATYVLNGPPFMLSTPTLNINEDSGSNSLNLSTFVSDTEQAANTLQYTVVSMTNSALFQQATISGTSLNVTPAADKYGSGSITVRITDSQSLFVETPVLVTVANVQDAPVFTSNPITVGAQDVLYTYNITAADIDLTDALTISNIIALPSWLTLTNTGNGTATLSGTPGAANIGTSGVAIKVTDDKGNFTQQFFDINVLEGQFPPQFTSTAITTARENTVYSYTATTSDFNGDPITYTAPTLPAWLTAAANGTGGFVLTGTPSLSHVYFENGNQDFPVVIRATDDTGLFTEQTFQIRVLYENSPPTVTLPSTTLTLNEDQAVYDFNLTGITDGGEVGQVITITATPSPTNVTQATVAYQSPQNTATVHIQPLSNANGTATITIRLQDNGKASKNFVVNTVTVTVNPVNDPPSITSTPTLRVNGGSGYSYNVIATDPDASDNLTFQLLSAPAWLNINAVNNHEALISGTAPANGSDALVKIRVSDPPGTTNDQEFTLIVNKPPVLQSTIAETNEDVTLELNKAFFQNLVSDPNADEIVKLKITQLPQGQLKFNGQNLAVGSEIQWNSFSLITYVPPLDYFGADSFGWNVSDGLLYANADASINLTIVTQNDPPEIKNLETAPITFSQGDAGAAISSQLTVIDVDDANLQSAVVSISESFEAATDELAYAKPADETSPITASFNKQTGELTLSGEASKSAYERALRNVKYKSTFLGQTDALSRKISMKVSDLISTSATVQRSLNIIRVLPDIEVVNAFTPNGDGVNDTWDFSNLIAYEAVKIFVFDGNGRRVYECKENNCAWDGKFKGKELPPGQYLYTIDLENGARQYQGTVTLLK